VVRRTFVLVSILALLTASPVAAQDPTPNPGSLSVPSDAVAKKSGVYLVRLAADPVVAYAGDIRGLAATRPAPGEKLNPNAAAVRRYVAYLVEQHDSLLAAVGAQGRKLMDYAYSYNGFAAVLTGAQAADLATMEGVEAVVPNEMRQLATDNSPTFLGLDAPGGLWEQLGGQGSAGEDIIVGVVDTGIWPEHPSVSDRTAANPGGRGKLSYRQVPGWYGKCVPGQEFNASLCNQKLIGARYFADGFLAAAGPLHSGEYLSARDSDGHGTHTATTAAGNAGVLAEVLGADYGEVSGIAPRARIAVYKACWTAASGAGGCTVADLVGAIDQAVADGVDVINYSIGSSAQTLLGQDDIAFLFAADAGVFVATSAGNAGPGASTVGSPASVPWVTSVGASTQSRNFLGSVTLGNEANYTGVTITGGTDVLPIVDSEDLTPSGDFTDEQAELCYLGSLQASEVSGKIVLCKRGAIARVEKSQAVFEAGGAGMILYNAVANDTLNTDNHYVPSLHVDVASGTAIKAYIDAAESAPTAQIHGGAAEPDPGAPDMAAFSSRGPNGAAPDIIKPDVTAPGVNILAGNTPTALLGAPGQLFQAISGTSMSSPHVAGAGALLAQAHPDWSPAMIKSALMTTAYQEVDKEDGSTPADPFDMGGGHIEPTSAADPGLVYDADFLDYLAFLCGATSGVGPSTCDFLAGQGYSFDASDLNLPSIGIADLAGIQTITRTVTNVGPAATYAVSVDAPPGIGVAVTPSSMSLGSGASASYKVTFTTTSVATLDEWTFGSLTWSHGPHEVRSPIAIKPVALAAPSEQTGTGTDGSLTYGVTFGYEGPFSAEPYGLVPATMTPGTVDDDPSNNINAALDTCDFSTFPFECTGVTWHAVSVPVGTEHLRISLFDDYTDGADDLDLYVFDSAFAFVGGSGGGTSEEEVNIPSPADPTYFVAVHGWQTDGPDANYTLFDWSVPAADAGNTTVTTSTDTATLGGTAEVTVAWSGLTADTKYLGAVAYNGGAHGLTLIRVDTD